MFEADSLKVLTPEQAESFVRDGFVTVRQAFSRDTAERLLPHVWAKLEEDPDDPSTWTAPAAEIQEVIHEGPSEEMFTERYRGSLDDLLGEGRWIAQVGFGWLPIRFPGFKKPPWKAPRRGWHVDGIHFHHHLTSPEQGVVGIEMLTDILPGGGGTALRVGSHKAVARLLREREPEGVSYRELRRLVEPMDDFEVVEANGEAGDILWMHPFLIHCRSPNTRDRVRIVSNRWIALEEPMKLERRDGRHSLVEEAIRAALAEG